MKTLPSIIAIGSISLLAFSAQAAIINVTNETLYMNSEVTLGYPSGLTQLHRSSYLGSLFSGDRIVDAYDGDNYIPYSDPSDGYEQLSISMNAEFEADVEATRTTYWMEVETDVYPLGDTHSPDPAKVIDSVSGYQSLIEITMDFFVTGAGADISFDIINEGTYAPVTFVLDDLTTSTRIADLTSYYSTDPSGDSALLLDGHHYSMSLMVSEQSAADEDLFARLRFDNAQVVSAAVAEPGLILLFSLGLTGLGVVRRWRH
jgi:hypothetical protein